MKDGANSVIDARLSEALGAYFNGVALLKTVGDCALLSGVRKQNGAPVTIYTPSFSAARDDALVAELGRAFATFDKLSAPQLEASERLLTSRAFKKSPVLAVLACPEPVFDPAFDTMDVAARLGVLASVLDGLAALHSAGLVHGNLSPDTVRREQPGAALRLTELTFAGERATTLLHQPPEYQSRHVINSGQPRPEDDVHAAGMLAYRILLGPGGPARALTGGPAEPEAITAAILGEGAAPLTAEELFPEGHPSGDQIARLLARMTGRLPNAAPYSGAEAARRAFDTVLNTQSAPVLPAVLGSPAQAAPEVAPRAAASAPPPARPRSGGVSGLTAVTIFAGFLASTAAACYLYLENQTLVGQNAELTRVAQGAVATREAETAAFVALRQADRALATAEASGGALASEASADGLLQAQETLAAADATDDPGEAQGLAAEAQARAEAALQAIAEARATARQAEAAAGAALERAGLAIAPDTAPLGAALAGIDAAETAWDAGQLDRAATAWAEASAALDDITQTARATAETAREGAHGAAPEIASPAAILGRSYLGRADTAFDAAQFAQAEALYLAAMTAFGARAEAAPVGVDAAPREVSLGDSPAQIAAALDLCRTAAPIDPARCPEARPAGESARAARVAPFALDASEVSASQFARFIEAEGYETVAERTGEVVAFTPSGEARMAEGGYSWATPHGAGSSIDAEPERPVTNVALEDAVAYCAWAGGRLPTEAEWEAVARGDSQSAFPWGAWDPAGPVWRGAEDAARRLAVPVDRAGGASAAGHQGLAGNVREWVLTPEGAVLKGGSWNTVNPADLRISARLIVPGNAPGIDFGFRCATDLEVWP